MKSSNGSARAGVLGGHICAGVVAGTIFGALYFLVEAIAGSRGQLAYLGGPLARIMGVYLLFGLSVGALVGAALGTAAVLMRVRASADQYVPYYFTAFAFLLVFMRTAGKHSMASFKAIPTSQQMIWFLLLLIGLAAAGFVLARVLRARGVFRRAGRRAALLMVIACLVAVGGAHGVANYSDGRLPRSRASGTQDGPNVVFIVLDAFRADHLSAAGYHRDTTPSIDRLAHDGVLFRKAYSHGNRTIISVPSIFTSLYPSFHGVGGRGKFARPLAEEWTTMAELFRSAGYTTIGLVPNAYFRRQFGLGQGFDRLESFNIGRYDLGLYRMLSRFHFLKTERSRYRPAATEMTATALRWAERVKRRPFFLYLHYMDTHHPYAPPPPYDTLYGAGTEGMEPIELFYETTRLAKQSAASELGKSEIEKLKDYYDGSIRFTDDQIGRLVEEIVAEGSRETIVVVTADHGDEFLEHGSVYHNNIVIEELIHVPLVFWSSKRFARGTTVDCLVRHIDLLPTLAEIIGVDAPPQTSGQSLVPLLEGQTDSFDLKSIAEGDYCTSLNYQNWKIVRVDTTDSYHFYDLTRRPREKKDVCSMFPDECAQLRAWIEEYLERASAVKRGREVEVDEKTIRELKALGYL